MMSRSGRKSVLKSNPPQEEIFTDRRTNICHVESTSQSVSSPDSTSNRPNSPSVTTPVMGKCRRFYCTICNKSYTKRQRLILHMRKCHNGEKLLSCDMCENDFEIDSALQHHIKTRHGNSCDQCSKRLSSKGKLLMHQKLFHHDKQDDMGMMQFTEEAKPSPEKTRTVPGAKPMETRNSISDKRKHRLDCSECGKSFANETTLRYHENRYHDPPSKRFNNESGVVGEYPASEDQQGETEDSAEDRFNCRLCGRGFSIQDDLTAHLILCHSYLRCGVCEEIFPHINAETKHREHCHPEVSLNCSFCPKNFQTRENTLSHMTQFHAGIRCRICKQWFSGRASIIMHMNICGRAVVRIYKCHLCDIQCTDFTSLSTHIKTCHFTETFQCRFCPRVLDSLADRSAHEHSCASLTKCAICSKTFYTNADLSRHLAKCHLKCNICGESFKNENDLSTHFSTVHHVEKSFVCTQCNKKFKYAHVLKAHVIVMHGQSKDSMKKTTYTCQICSKDFAHDHSLQMHIKTHGFGKQLNCGVCSEMFAKITEHIELVHCATSEKENVKQYIVESIIGASAEQSAQSATSTLREEEAMLVSSEGSAPDTDDHVAKTGEGSGVHAPSASFSRTVAGVDGHDEGYISTEVFQRAYQKEAVNSHTGDMQSEDSKDPSETYDMLVSFLADETMKTDASKSLQTGEESSHVAVTTDVHSDLASVHPDLASVHPDLASVHSDLTSVHSDLASVHPDLTSVHSDLASVHPDLASVHSDLTSVHSDLTSVHPDLASVHPDLTSVHSDLAAGVVDIDLQHSVHDGHLQHSVHHEDSSHNGHLQHSVHHEDSSHNGHLQHSVHHEDSSHDGFLQHSVHHEDNSHNGHLQHSVHHEDSSHDGHLQHSVHHEDSSHDGHLQHSVHHEDSSHEGHLQHSVHHEDISHDGHLQHSVHHEDISHDGHLQHSVHHEDRSHNGHLQHSVHHEDISHDGHLQHSVYHEDRSHNGHLQHSVHHEDSSHLQHSVHHEDSSHDGHLQHSVHHEDRSHNGHLQHSVHHEDNSHNGHLQHSVHHEDNSHSASLFLYSDQKHQQDDLEVMQPQKKLESMEECHSRDLSQIVGEGFATLNNVDPVVRLSPLKCSGIDESDIYSALRNSDPNGDVDMRLLQPARQDGPLRCRSQPDASTENTNSQLGADMQTNTDQAQRCSSSMQDQCTKTEAYAFDKKCILEEEKVDSRSDVENGDSCSDVKNGDNRSDVKNGDSLSDVENGDSCSDVKNGHSRSDVENSDSLSDVENGDSRSDVENDDSRNVKNGDSRNDVKNGDSRNDVENDDNRSDVENGDKNVDVNMTNVDTGKLGTVPDSVDGLVPLLGDIEAGNSTSQEYASTHRLPSYCASNEIQTSEEPMNIDLMVVEPDAVVSPREPAGAPVHGKDREFSITVMEEMVEQDHPVVDVVKISGATDKQAAQTCESSENDETKQVHFDYQSNFQRFCENTARGLIPVSEDDTNSQSEHSPVDLYGIAGCISSPESQTNIGIPSWERSTNRMKLRRGSSSYSLRDRNYSRVKELSNDTSKSMLSNDTSKSMLSNDTSKSMLSNDTSKSMLSNDTSKSMLSNERLLDNERSPSMNDCDKFGEDLKSSNDGGVQAERRRMITRTKARCSSRSTANVQERSPRAYSEKQTTNAHMEEVEMHDENTFLISPKSLQSVSLITNVEEVFRLTQTASCLQENQSKQTAVTRTEIVGHSSPSYDSQQMANGTNVSQMCDLGQFGSPLQQVQRDSSTIEPSSISDGVSQVGQTLAPSHPVPMTENVPPETSPNKSDCTSEGHQTLSNDPGSSLGPLQTRERSRVPSVSPAHSVTSPTSNPQHVLTDNVTNPDNRHQPSVQDSSLNSVQSVSRLQRFNTTDVLAPMNGRKVSPSHHKSSKYWNNGLLQDPHRKQCIRFTCGLCQAFFPTVEALNQHKLMQHSLRCTQCGNTYTRMMDLIDHYESCP